MSKLRPILLAEDNPNDVELTLDALHSANLANEIIVVHDGAAAVEWLRAHSAMLPAVVILDLKMPRMDGLEALRKIREDPVLHAQPVVILTSSREESDIVGSYGLGVNAYVVKPVEFDGFISAVSQLGVFWAMLNESPPAGAK